MIDKIPTKKLAEFLDVTPGFVSQIKKGRRKMPPKDCLRVAKAFGLRPSEIRPDIFGDL
jgi:DNA-binding transcriptional regulator YdaS (Cro superfamily)